MHFGFSYIGLIFFILLLVPNLIWIKYKPKNYEEYAIKENKILVFIERIGEALVICTSLIFTDFNLYHLDLWSIFLGFAFLFMILYEAYWIKYFKSPKTMWDFYSSFMGIPLAGATLPVLSYILLGIYRKNIFLISFTILLGIGHIGIHFLHYKEINQDKDCQKIN